MQKRGFHPTFLLFKGTCVAEKRKTKKALEEYGGYRKTFLCPTTGITLLRRCRCSKIACAFGAAAPAAIFAGV